MTISDKRSVRLRLLPWLSAAILSLLLAGEAVYGADDDYFLRQHVDVPGFILGSREADFNGDGNTDVVLIVAEPDGRRTLKSYLQRESGRFPPTAGQTLQLSTSANVVQSCDIDGDGRMELYYIDSRGLWEFRYNGDEFSERPRSMVSLSTIFAAGIEGEILPQNCIYNLSGRMVAFLPISGGYSLWEYKQGEFERIGQLNFSHLFSISERPMKLFSSFSHNPQGCFLISMPEIVISESNGDDRDDVYLMWPDRVAIFEQDEQNRFDTENSLLFKFQNPSEGNLCQSSLVDYNLDGRLDIVCSRSLGGISGALTEVNFFHSTHLRRRDRTESYSVSLTDACGNLIVGDFNNNGSPELIVPAIELGIMSTVKKMITKKTDFHILIYPIDNLGRPAREPEIRKKVSCRLDFESADPTSSIRINWSGDYDGDGLPDLVVADGGGQLLFLRGNVDEYLEDKAELVLDLLNPSQIRPVHLNNDGCHDLVIIHKPEEGITRLTLLVTNRIG